MFNNSNNPFFKNKSFKGTENSDGLIHEATFIDYNETMSVNGTINKTIFMFLGLFATAAVTFLLVATGIINPYLPLLTGAIIGMISVLIVSFKPQYSPWIAPGYALFEGMFLGSLTIIFEILYPGIALQAVGATFATFAMCLILYRTGVVKVTEKMKSIVITATTALLLFYLMSWIVSLIFGTPMISQGNSLLSIGISVVVIVIASLNLFLDFDMIEKGAERRHPKFMEWFGAMGLMITVVWLYVEFLRLFSKIASRD